MLIVFGNRHSFLFHTSRQNVFCSRPQNKSFGSSIEIKAHFTRYKSQTFETKVKPYVDIKNQERSIYIVSATPQRVIISQTQDRLWRLSRSRKQEIHWLPSRCTFYFSLIRMTNQLHLIVSVWLAVALHRLSLLQPSKGETLLKTNIGDCRWPLHWQLWPSKTSAATSTTGQTAASRFARDRFPWEGEV
jgi:hypothetical protein